nr:copper transport protein ATX1-like [Ipomoea batatas]
MPRLCWGCQEGVESFDIDMEEQKVTVKGNVQPDEVLQTVSKTGKKTSFWESEAPPPPPPQPSEAPPAQPESAPPAQALEEPPKQAESEPPAQPSEEAPAQPKPEPSTAVATA